MNKGNIMHIKFLMLFLILLTIPIHPKISIPNIPKKISSFSFRSVDEITHHAFDTITQLNICAQKATISIEPWKQPCCLLEIHKKGSADFLKTIELESSQKDQTVHATIKAHDTKMKGNV